VEKDTDRDFILTAEDAVEYGVVDEVITSRKIIPELAAAAAGAPRLGKLEEGVLREARGNTS
jgi:hypothetical protein